MDNNILIRVIKSTERVLGKKLNKSDLDKLIPIVKSYINKMDANTNTTSTKDLESKSPNYTVNELVLIASSTFIEQQQHTLDSGEPEQIDTHELLKTQIGTRDENDVIYSPALATNEASLHPTDVLFVDADVNLSKLLNVGNMYDFVNIINPTAHYKKTYIVFDTRFVSYTNINRTKFTWNFVNSNDTSLGSINALGAIRDIVSLKVYKFNLPGIVAPSLLRVSLNFEEFQAQSFIGHEDRRFHIMAITENVVDGFGTITPVTPYVVPFPAAFNYRTQMYMQEPMNYGEFYFHKPVTILDKLTLSFADPYNLISIPQDKFLCTSCTFTTDINGSIVCYMIVPGIPAGLKVWNIDVEGFTTTNPIADSGIIQYMNGIVLGNATTIPLPPFPYNLSLTLVDAAFVGQAPFPPYPVGVPQPFYFYVAQFRTFVFTEMTYISSDKGSS
jgi:hypothetical protein